MAKKLTYQDFRTLLANVTDQTPGNSAKAHYALGALEFILADIARDLPLAKQKDLALSIGSLAERLKSY